MSVLTDETISDYVKQWIKGGQGRKDIEKDIGHISDWDVSRVTYMGWLFFNTEFNEPIGIQCSRYELDVS